MEQGATTSFLPLGMDFFPNFIFVAFKGDSLFIIIIIICNMFTRQNDYVKAETSHHLHFIAQCNFHKVRGNIQKNMTQN